MFPPSPFSHLVTLFFPNVTTSLIRPLFWLSLLLLLIILPYLHTEGRLTQIDEDGSIAFDATSIPHTDRLTIPVSATNLDLTIFRGTIFTLVATTGPFPPIFVLLSFNIPLT